MRNRTDGALTWKRDGLGRLQGSPVAAGESLVVFGNDTETVIALDVAKGEDTWRRTVGDVLLQAPIAAAEGVLVVTKSNRLLLLDAANGSIRAERQWPTWLVRVTRIETSPQAAWACTDIAGAVTLLSLDELKTQQVFELAAELTGPVVYVESLAAKWPREPARSRTEQEDLLAEIQQKTPKKGPTLLAADNQGFVYFLPLTQPE